jgi:hypothetical protein
MTRDQAEQAQQLFAEIKELEQLVSGPDLVDLYTGSIGGIAKDVLENIATSANADAVDYLKRRIEFLSEILGDL